MGARILVVEDNAANLELMVYLLEAFGHQTLVAGDGEAGLQAIRRERPDLVVCDLQLPKLSGYELVERAKAEPELAGIPLIAVTAFAMVGDREKVLAAGFDGYIPKPIAPDTFVPQIESFLSAGQPSPPRRCAAAAEAIEAPPNRMPQESATILAVDNSPENLSVLRCTFEPLGYTVICANNVPDAIELARKSHPDLILSDLHMPKENGYDFMQRIKQDEALRSIPFVFISSTVWHRDRMEEMDFTSAARFLQRPIEPQALIAEIKACLSAARER